MANGLRSLAKAAISATAFFFLLFFFEGHPLLEEKERTIIDDLGQRVKLKGDVKRIVSLVPSNSELVCLLDCARLKGGTRFDRFPQELVQRIREKKTEVIGGGFDPSLEKIVEIGPDLVLTNGPTQQRVVLPLKRMGYPVFSLYPQNIEGLRRDFLLLGEILDREAKARKIVEEADKGLKEIKRKTGQKRAKKVYLQTWPDPMITVGKGSISQEILSLAGGVNIFGDMPFDSGKVSVEWIIQRNPEVLIFVGGQEAFVDKILKLPEWRQIDGVKNRHICFVDETPLRRTIRFLEGVEKLYECLFKSDPS